MYSKLFSTDCTTKITLKNYIAFSGRFCKIILQFYALRILRIYKNRIFLKDFFTIKTDAKKGK